MVAPMLARPHPTGQALVTLVSCQFSRHAELAIEVGEIGRRVLLDHSAGEHAQAAVDVRHVRGAAALVVENYLAVLEDDVALVPALLVAEYGHQRRLSAALEGGPHGAIIDRQIGIAIEHQERRRQRALVEREPQRAARPAQPVAFVDVADLEAPSLAAADVSADGPPQMTDAVDDLRDA